MHCIVIAWLPVRTSRSRARTHPPWAERVLGKGGVFLAFGVGIVLNIVPGVVPIVAIKDIAELDIGAGPKRLAVLPCST